MPAQESLSQILSQQLKNQTEFVYLMGSAETDRFHRESDIDVAVYWKPFISDEAKKKIHIDLESTLQRDIDLVSLNDIDVIFARQVLETGRLLENNNPGLHLSWCAQKLSEYPDFKRSRKIVEDHILTRKKHV